MSTERDIVEPTVSAATVQAVRDMIERDPLIREALIPAEITSLAQQACRVVAADSAAEIRRLRAANEELVGALKECADDLATEIDATHAKDTPNDRLAARRYERDMVPVIRARSVLSRNGGAGT